MLPKFNRKRALFVLTKIDEILAWERRLKRSAIPALWSWAGISVKYEPVSTGGWRD
jgi:hypothetical protein